MLKNTQHLRAVSCAAAICALVVVPAHGGIAASGNDKRAPGGDKVAYQGAISSDTGGAVTFTDNPAEGRFRAAQFTASDIAIQCDDGTSRSDTFSVVRAPFVTKRHFDRDKFISAGTIDNAYYRVHGEVRKNGQARGFVFYHSTGTGTENGTGTVVDCTSVGGKQPWRASTTGARR